MMELDSMFATMDLVALSEWATILPGALCLPDIGGGRRRVIPISTPGMTVDYLRIEPVATPLSDAGEAFYEILMEELTAALAQLEVSFQT